MLRLNLINLGLALNLTLFGQRAVDKREDLSVLPPEYTSRIFFHLLK